MLDIVIVEDDRLLAEQEMKYVKSSWKRKEEIKISIYENAETLLRDMKNGKKIDILLVDIELPGMSGIELGRTLKEFEASPMLIFLTAHDGFAVESYKLGAQQYVLKSDMKERLGIILTDCGEKILQRREKVRFIRMNGEINKLIYEKVLYFYKEGKYVVYITGNGILKERITLEDAYEKTGGYPFLKVERGFVVNTNYMVKMSETTIFMSDGSEIPVSRRLLPKIRREIMINRSRIC